VAEGGEAECLRMEEVAAGGYRGTEVGYCDPGWYEFGRRFDIILPVFLSSFAWHCSESSPESTRGQRAAEQGGLNNITVLILIEQIQMKVAR